MDMYVHTFVELHIGIMRLLRFPARQNRITWSVSHTKYIYCYYYCNDKSILMMMLDPYHVYSCTKKQRPRQQQLTHVCGYCYMVRRLNEQWIIVPRPSLINNAIFYLEITLQYFFREIVGSARQILVGVSKLVSLNKIWQMASRSLSLPLSQKGMSLLLGTTNARVIWHLNRNCSRSRSGKRAKCQQFTLNSSLK